MKVTEGLHQLHKKLRAKKLLLILFVGLGMLFVVGSAFKIQPLLIGSNLLLVPVLLLYYRYMARKIFIPIVLVLLLLYIRDFFLIYGIEAYLAYIWISFILAILILFLCMVTEFQRSKTHPVEILSFLIMYGFLTFLFITLSEGIPKDNVFFKWAGYSYLLLLMLLTGGSFTSYIMKSHMASLWFMVATASFLVSEVSLFFKVLILEDVSVNFFYPFFHVLAYYGFVQYGLKRRITGSYKIF